MINPYGLKGIPAWLWRLLRRFPGRKPASKLSTLDYVVLDTETTGFDYEKDRILCIGALKLSHQRIRVQDALEVYIEQEHYNCDSTAIHGILSREERPRLQEAEALRLFVDYLGEAVIVAHHAQFDMTMINTALQRHGMPKLTNKVLDTSTLYRKTLIASPLIRKKERYTLDDLADTYDISKKDRHTALGDAYITAIAFLKILQALNKKGITTLGKAMGR